MDDIIPEIKKRYKLPFIYHKTILTHDIDTYTASDLAVIAKKQLELEKEYLPKANRFLFCDTSLITIKIWSTHKFNKVPTYISKSIKDNDYDLSLITNNDVPWVADPQRRNEIWHAIF